MVVMANSPQIARLAHKESFADAHVATDAARRMGNVLTMAAMDVMGAALNVSLDAAVMTEISSIGRDFIGGRDKGPKTAL
ncbi:hypothetical protein GJ744_005804 [Endocarpon pusillum]|uniref:Uncharacterized protein n=1 Tax=Endocarpon pusillum TaxID=364733 RepID=A0A8H7A4F0_9EURO|nr:hypothetical protein GJ744_005804 [Endocarpon pusillum]